MSSKKLEPIIRPKTCIIRCLDEVEEIVKIIDFMKRKRRHFFNEMRHYLISKVPITRLLHHLARYGKTDEIRLTAARQLNDPNILKQLAREANQATVRMEAALLAKDQASLTALALNAWDINQGEKIVEHISNVLLLKRIARSARQDPVRLAAALRLADRSLLRNLSKTTPDIYVRWRIAQHLNDPNLLADIARFKPANGHFAPLRNLAYCSLLNHLDKLAAQGNSTALFQFMRTQSHPDFKMEAFIRIPCGTMRAAFIRDLALCDFKHACQGLIEKMLEKIKDSGWHTTQIMLSTSCNYCLGKGTLLEKSVHAYKSHCNSVDLPCVECNGRGRIQFWQVACQLEKQAPIALRLPAETRLRRLPEEDLLFLQ